jgi:hypothetical protein
LAVLIAVPSVAMELSDSRAGISVSAPDGWTVQTREEIRDTPKKYALPDGTPPADHDAVLFKFTKYVEPTDKLNPTFQVVRYPNEGWTPAEAVRILEMWSVDATLPGSEWIDEPNAIEFKGRSAAKSSFKKTLVTKEGVQYVFLVRNMMIVRNGDLIGLKMSSAESGSDRCDSEFSAILTSLMLE